VVLGYADSNTCTAASPWYSEGEAAKKNEVLQVLSYQFSQRQKKKRTQTVLRRLTLHKSPHHTFRGGTEVEDKLELPVGNSRNFNQAEEGIENKQLPGEGMSP